MPTSKPLVMGILNVTPDSFFDGGYYQTSEECFNHIAKMINDGADILDIGGYSTRPGADNIDTETEINRVLPVAQLIKKHYPNTLISIDTFRSEVARRVVDSVGACIINDVSGGDLDEHMFDTIASLGVPYIMMHMRGTPETMQNLTNYTDVTSEVVLHLSQKLNTLYKKGAKDIIIDPGFGFAKTLDQNYELLNKLNRFQIFTEPLLVGVSRKSMIYNVLNTSAVESKNGTTVINTLALQAGANILRVHDVKEAAETIALIGKVKESLTL